MTRIPPPPTPAAKPAPEGTAGVEAIDRFAVVREACRRLKLPPRETTLMRDCLTAWGLVSNGYILVSPGRVPAARRLIERGFLAQAPEQPVPFDPVHFGLVIVAERGHFNKLIADANAVTVRAA